MTNRIPTGPAAIAGAIGSAAVAAALLYASKRKDRKNETGKVPHVPGGENPETD